MDCITNLSNYPNTKGYYEVDPTHCGNYIFGCWVEAVASASQQPIFWYHGNMYNNDTKEHIVGYFLCSDSGINKRLLSAAIRIIPCPGDIIKDYITE